jgi:hypothetical protein
VILSVPVLPSFCLETCLLYTTDLTKEVIVKQHQRFSSRMFSLKLVRNFSISRRNWWHSEIISFGHRNEFFSRAHLIVTACYSLVHEPWPFGLRLATTRPINVSSFATMKFGEVKWQRTKSQVKLVDWRAYVLLICTDDLQLTVHERKHQTETYLLPYRMSFIKQDLLSLV